MRSNAAAAAGTGRRDLPPLTGLKLSTRKFECLFTSAMFRRIIEIELEWCYTSWFQRRRLVLSPSIRAKELLVKTVKLNSRQHDTNNGAR